MILSLITFFISLQYEIMLPCNHESEYFTKYRKEHNPRIIMSLAWEFKSKDGLNLKENMPSKRDNLIHIMPSIQMKTSYTIQPQNEKCPSNS